jgi:hypothetical protein
MCQWIRRLSVSIIPILSLLPRPANAQLPSTDIWLAEVRVIRNEVEIGKPMNVTRRIGYDNQPYFYSDCRSFLYTRGDSTGTDVYRFDIPSGRITQVTKTPESEYSPTPFSDPRDGFCTVRVESDSTQRLWRFDGDGTHPRLVLANVDSVGYFAWIDRSTIALFVVGSPNTLRVVDVETEREKTIARDIGRALHRIPTQGGVSFLLRAPGSEPARYSFWTWSQDVDRTEWLIDPVGAGQDATWVGDQILMADGPKLYRARPYDSPDWHEVIDLGTYGISSITRLVVSRDKRHLAFVASEPE